MMTTVYSICIRSAGGDELDDREHRGGVRREAFSTRGNFLDTCIRQRPWFCILGGATKKSLLATVSFSVIAETSFVACAGRAMARGPALFTAPVAAVLLPVIIRAADEEHVVAPAARQLENGNSRVQGSGCDRQKFGGRPRPWDE